MTRTYPYADVDQPPEQDNVLVAIIVAALLLFATACMIDGCGASAEVRGAYALEHARCQANEREIVTREGTTYEADLEALEIERARCDAALRAIEESEQ